MSGVTRACVRLLSYQSPQLFHKELLQSNFFSNISSMLSDLSKLTKLTHNKRRKFDFCKSKDDVAQAHNVNKRNQNYVAPLKGLRPASVCIVLIPFEIIYEALPGQFFVRRRSNVERGKRIFL